MAKPTHFQSEFDKVLSGFIKEAGGPPPIPDDVYELNPWAEEEGEDKPIGMMTKEELASFVRGLDDKTFTELKTVLDKVEMPEANDVQEVSDRHTRPTVETLVEPERHTRPTVMTLAPEAKEEKKQEFLSSPDFEAAFNEWIAGQRDYKSSTTFDEAYGEYEKVAEVRLSKRTKRD